MAGPLSRAALEDFLPCSIEYFLSHSTLVDSKAQSKNITHPTLYRLPQAPKDGSRYYLTIEDVVKGGDFSTAKSYVNDFWKAGMTYTDIQFWFFNAYNGPGTAKFDNFVFNKVKNTGNVDLAPLGEHVGDWESCAIRIDNASKDMIGIMLSAHGKNVFYSKDDIAKRFKMINETHPFVYASLNGHANFPTPGPNYSEHRKALGISVGLEFSLLNSTVDGGAQLDCSKKYQVMKVSWLEGTPDAYASPAWVEYPYRWRPEGTATTMSSKNLGDFIKAALGDKEVDASCVVLAASELLHVFVTANINGSMAPEQQGPWSGAY
ncbi:hypothetical protein BJ878DRAFT_539298 [Calycina marina]|uniref:Uncharacterized protein n=1 Tax=Calycina marina TaxID=1763456 RepID=A0A9P7Z8L1_9HELO|nr:hypothetical protein BJ878DRAFT_539298 [Calycina marina]